MKAFTRREFLGLSTVAAAGLLSMPNASKAGGRLLAGPLPPSRNNDQALFEQVSASTEAYLAQYKLPGLSFGIVAHDELVFSRAFGVKNVSTGQPYTVDSVQCMQSVSKSVMATALMQLVEAGKMNVDRPLIEFLPNFSLSDQRYRQITIRHVLGHTSGLPFTLPSEASDPFGEFLDPWFDAGAAERLIDTVVAENPSLVSSPGGPFNYSDLAYDMLAAVVHKVSGEVFEDYCQRHIFGPLGMRSTTFLRSDVPTDKLVQAHVLDSAGNPSVSAVYPYARQHAPSSCLHSNVPDMSRWLVTQLNHGKLGRERILKPSSHKEMWQPLSTIDPTASYCWGCFATNIEGHPAIGYFGGILVQTAMVVVPDRNLGVIALSNLDAPWVVGEIAYSAMSQLLAEKCCQPVQPGGLWRKDAFRQGPKK